MPRTSFPLRRYFAMLGVALLTAAWAAGVSIPASAASVKGYLQITSITDQQSGLGGQVPNARPLEVDVAGPVQNRLFDVAVRVLDRPPDDPNAQPLAVTKATTIELGAPGPGDLGPNRRAVIPRNGFAATISGATYSEVANGVVLSVGVVTGVELGPDEVPVAVALTAVAANASPKKSLDLSDPNCAAPTAAAPTCGRFLLPNGASGPVTMSVGSCEGLGNCMTEGSTEALVVTAIADLKDYSKDPDHPEHRLYTRTSPATMVLACDKALCREISNGVPKIPVLYTFDNTGELNLVAAPCPAKGVVGDDQKVCVDYVSSSRNQGDLYMVVHFVHDIRFSF